MRTILLVYAAVTIVSLCYGLSLQTRKPVADSGLRIRIGGRVQSLSKDKQLSAKLTASGFLKNAKSRNQANRKQAIFPNVAVQKKQGHIREILAQKLPSHKIKQQAPKKLIHHTIIINKTINVHHNPGQKARKAKAGNGQRGNQHSHIPHKLDIPGYSSTLPVSRRKLYYLLNSLKGGLLTNKNKPYHVSGHKPSGALSNTDRQHQGSVNPTKRQGLGMVSRNQLAKLYVLLAAGAPGRSSVQPQRRPSQSQTSQSGAPNMAGLTNVLVPLGLNGLVGHYPKQSSAPGSPHVVFSNGQIGRPLGSLAGTVRGSDALFSNAGNRNHPIHDQSMGLSPNLMSNGGHQNHAIPRQSPVLSQGLMSNGGHQNHPINGQSPGLSQGLLSNGGNQNHPIHGQSPGLPLGLMSNRENQNHPIHGQSPSLSQGLLSNGGIQNRPIYVQSPGLSQGLLSNGGIQNHPINGQFPGVSQGLLSNGASQNHPIHGQSPALSKDLLSNKANESHPIHGQSPGLSKDSLSNGANQNHPIQGHSPALSQGLLLNEANENYPIHEQSPGLSKHLLSNGANQNHLILGLSPGLSQDLLSSGPNSRLGLPRLPGAPLVSSDTLIVNAPNSNQQTIRNTPLPGYAVVSNTHIGNNHTRGQISDTTHIVDQFVPLSNGQSGQPANHWQTGQSSNDLDWVLANGKVGPAEGVPFLSNTSPLNVQGGNEQLFDQSLSLQTPSEINVLASVIDNLLSNSTGTVPLSQDQSLFSTETMLSDQQAKNVNSNLLDFLKHINMLEATGKTNSVKTQRQQNLGANTNKNVNSNSNINTNKSKVTIYPGHPNLREVTVHGNRPVTITTFNQNTRRNQVNPNSLKNIHVPRIVEGLYSPNVGLSGEDPPEPETVI